MYVVKCIRLSIYLQMYEYLIAISIIKRWPVFLMCKVFKTNMNGGNYSMSGGG